MHIITDEGKKHNYTIKLAFMTTNNEVEYEALFFIMTIAKTLGVKKVEIRAKSLVVVSQVQGEFVAKSEKLKKYLTLVQAKRAHF